MTQDTFLETPERERASLRSRIAGEYREMPGLGLTLAQAARLWGLDRATTERVLESLSKPTSCPEHAMASTDCPENHDAQSEREFGMARSGRCGGFASGTSALVRTRRYHGLLAMAVTPPTGRVMLVNGFEVWITTPNGRFGGGGHISWRLERRSGLARLEVRPLLSGRDEDLAGPGVVSWALEGGEAFWILSASTAERRRNVRRPVTSDAGTRHRIVVSSDASILGPRENTACGSRGERT